MNKILFSIVIPTYNRAELLKRCLDSIEAQTYQNWEAIVVDNYSGDNTEEVVNAYGDPRIVYVKNHNYGVIAVSRNKALDMAKGDWVAFLDSDDCWLPNKLESVLAYVEDFDLVYHGYQKNMPKKGFCDRRNCYFYEIKEPSVGYVLQRGDPLSTSCTCLSRDIIGESRFDESKELFAVEDYDFFLQILDKAPKIKYLRKVLTLYDVSGVSHTMKLVERDTRLMKKWWNWLNEDERREAHYQLKYREACASVKHGDLERAAACYKECAMSKIWMKRKKGIRGYLKMKLKLFLNRK